MNLFVCTIFFNSTLVNAIHLLWEEEFELRNKVKSYLHAENLVFATSMATTARKCLLFAKSHNLCFWLNQAICSSMLANKYFQPADFGR